MLLMGEEAQGGFGSQNGSTSSEPPWGGRREKIRRDWRGGGERYCPGDGSGRPAWIGDGRRRPGLLASARAAPKGVTVPDAET